jgi:cystathionine gamma-lyase
VCDLELVADLAHAEGALVCVDNTIATPLDQRPLALGADLSMASASKALSGHADLILGHVAARDPELLEPARQWRRTTGAVPGPFETWLAHRSLATLDVRLARQCENAGRIAELLAAREDVAEVRYPGLPDDPSYRVAARQMRRFGPVVSFDLGTRERADAVLGRAELVADATSFGGVHTSAERRARWGHGDDVGEGFVRLSAGVEATADLLADLERALDSA